MSAENWIVKTVRGNEWGFVRRLVLNSVTRQISHADVVLLDTGCLIRLPWESFDVVHDGIRLKVSDGQVPATAVSPSEGRNPETVFMELWP